MRVKLLSMIQVLVYVALYSSGWGVMFVLWSPCYNYGCNAKGECEVNSKCNSNLGWFKSNMDKCHFEKFLFVIVSFSLMLPCFVFVPF